MEGLLGILPHLSSILTGALMWQVWNIRSAFIKAAADSAATKATSFENKQMLIDLEKRVKGLEEDHRDIMRNQGDSMEYVRELSKQHGKHEIIYARIEKDLETIKRKIDK